MAVASIAVFFSNAPMWPCVEATTSAMSSRLCHSRRNLFVRGHPHRESQHLGHATACSLWCEFERNQGTEGTQLYDARRGYWFELTSPYFREHLHDHLNHHNARSLLTCSCNTRPKESKYDCMLSTLVGHRTLQAPLGYLGSCSPLLVAA